eukprot:CAMPEP_0204349492 /NCGR_PEP_ID=MMETSP0469-20131031/29575_1 /ASSEMBLY_ACC=CAM_ASM_000384 /TAXON_ID=2969 /ORGANISM="Oxyrrhis marina" /LENGTH=42 /DNA_ID= /DNA_START= /DNA_END= /DNA_ORIENTATION=
MPRKGSAPAPAAASKGKAAAAPKHGSTQRAPPAAPAAAPSPA